MLDLPVYLDNHSTTRTDPRVLEVMWPFFSQRYGNPASVHRHGKAANDAVEVAREETAKALGCRPREVVFTSGATEANNLALKGVASAQKQRGHIVSAVNEHKAVLDALKRLEHDGWRVTLVGCDETGMVAVEAIEEALTDQTALVSVMAANNEVGTINPIAEIGKLCRRRGILFHTDATQAVGKLPIDVEAGCIDLLSTTVVTTPSGC